MFDKFKKRGYVKVKIKKKRKIKRNKKITNNNTNNKRKCAFNFSIFIILIIGNIFLILIFLTLKKRKILNLFSKSNSSLINSPSDYNLENHYYSRGKTLDRGLPYIKNCRQGNLTINPKNFKYTKNPKISAVVPIYNCEKTLKAAIRSIQNQDMLDIEIILVNDNSNQKTVDILQELSREDPRIEIINNEKRRGQFYSRNIGALKSRGEYIVNLDSDDMYIDCDVFNTLYYAIKEGDFDILAHKMFEAYSFTDRYYIREHIFNNRKHNLTIYQPRLSCYPISSHGHWKMNDLNIWGKLYKASIYKSAVNALGEERYSYYAVFIEDYLMLFLLCNFASSFKFIKKYGLFHKVSSSSSSNKVRGDEIIFGELFFIEIIFDFGKAECKNHSVPRFARFSGGYKRTNDENKKYYIKIFKKMMAAKDITENDKNIIRNKFRNFSPFNTSEFKKNFFYN